MQTFARILEFSAYHWMLSGLFILILGLLIVHELRRGGRTVSPRELTMLVNRGEGIILDVRSKKDFDGGHIVNSQHIAAEKLAGHFTELEKHKDKVIMVVDAMGQHSGTVCRELKKAGYNTVRLAGGIATWRNDNLPLTRK